MSFPVQRFVAPDERVTVFTFWRPLVVNSIMRFNILDATYNFIPLLSDGDFCWNIELFGCLQSQGMAHHLKHDLIIIPFTIICVF